jgi:hypothetical protein
MPRILGSAILRLGVAPGAVAALAAFELWHGGALTALGVGWLVFVLCVFAVAAWGKFQLDRTRRRLRSLGAQRSRKPR